MINIITLTENPLQRTFIIHPLATEDYSFDVPHDVCVTPSITW